MKASDLLYGMRKRGPGPKAVDMEKIYEDRLNTALAQGEGGIDTNNYNVEVESVCLSEIIISIEDIRAGYAIQLTFEPSFDGRKPTYPVEGTIQPLYLDDDKGRWYYKRENPGTIIAKDSRNISIDCANYLAAGLAEQVINEMITPAMESL